MATKCPVIPCLAIGRSKGPLNKQIPISLVGSGSLFTGMMLFTMCGLASIGVGLSVVGCLFAFILIFTVFNNYPPNYEDPDAEDYCNQVLYLYSFAYTILFCGLLIGSGIYWIARKCKKRFDIR